MKSVAIYCRVFTQEQAAEGYSIGEQQSRLSIFCAAHDWKVAHVYSDPGYSGAKLQCPAIQQLIRDCSYGLFDAVLVYKFDKVVLYPDHIDIHWTFATKKEEAV